MLAAARRIRPSQPLNKQREKEIRSGQHDIVLVTPQRLQNLNMSRRLKTEWHCLWWMRRIGRRGSSYRCDQRVWAGIDKPTCASLFTATLVKSYYQEAGRARRDGEPSRCVLFYRLEDKTIRGFLLGGSRPRASGERCGHCGNCKGLVDGAGASEA
jgi:hypothetical protein